MRSLLPGEPQGDLTQDHDDDDHVKVAGRCRAVSLAVVHQLMLLQGERLERITQPAETLVHLLQRVFNVLERVASTAKRKSK